MSEQEAFDELAAKLGGYATVDDFRRYDHLNDNISRRMVERAVELGWSPPGQTDTAPLSVDEALVRLDIATEDYRCALDREAASKEDQTTVFDPAHPDYCLRDRGCTLEAGHTGACSLTAAL